VIRDVLVITAKTARLYTLIDVAVEGEVFL
jgi:hypothetical protein